MIKPVPWPSQFGKSDAEMHYPDDSSGLTRSHFLHVLPTVPCRTPGVAVWLHNHMQDVAAYRPSPLSHYGTLKGLPKIIPLFQP